MASLEEERRIDQKNFRDHLATVNEEGKRNWIYPKKPSGRFYKARNIVAVLLLAFFFSGPFITINGNPLLLLNILERKFEIFGFLATGPGSARIWDAYLYPLYSALYRCIWSALVWMGLSANHLHGNGIPPD